jgi:hypothetical protein
VTGATANFTIEQRAIHVTADPQTKVYGDADPALTYTYTGVLQFSDAFTGGLTRAAGEDVGDYAIGQGTLALNGNYALTYTGDDLTITQRAIHVTADPQTKVYGDADPALTYTYTGVLQFSDAFTGGLTRAAGEDVGDYAIGQGTLALNGNYALTYTGDDLTITKADTTTSAANKSATFGDLSATLTATVTANSPSLATVNEGTVTFVVKKNGDTLDTLTSATISGGAASASLTLDADYVVGDYAIYATYNPASSAPNFNGSNDATPATLTIGQKATTLAITQPASVQYSDPFTLTATVSPASLNGQTVTGSVEFFVGGTSVGSASVNGSGDATLTNIPNTRAPANYDVTATFTSTNPNFTGSSGGPVTLTVTKEDARAFYTGNLIFWGASSSATSATVTLSATIKDITAVDSVGDPDAGDIRNATVTFLSNGSPVSGCTNLPVSLVNAGDLKVGTVSCNATFSIGSSGATQYTIGIQVNNYYTRNDPADNDVITVARPLSTNFITGGGYLVLSSSAGRYAGDAGSKANYGFNVKYNKGGTNLQGNVNIIIRAGGRVYQIKSNSLTSLGVNPANCLKATLTSPCKANFTSKANLTDITDPANPISLGGNLTLQMQMTDKGEPGSSDSIAFALYNGSKLLFSSNWNGTKTIEQTVGGGNLVVH